ncbi:DUF6538 domain-containing protein [Methylorubrum aminovorans]|uniref:DUF6538 domain-containing protein n=1 Tax=Methylorubrum aminovorans TaxID=269069 RepID=UPI003C2F8DB8
MGHTRGTREAGRVALATNLHRRGAVYYWRRRMPARFALATGANWLKLSLMTREPVRARFLDLTGWLWTGLIERISQGGRSRTCGEDRRRAQSRWC